MNQFEQIIDIKARRRAFIEDEAAFYNSKNRCADAMGCYYHPLPHSPGCAIGRHLDRNSEVIRRKLKGTITNILEFTGRNTKDYFPTWMLEMGSCFLRDCQFLHDDAENWNENGLSKKGKEYFNQLLKIYC